MTDGAAAILRGSGVITVDGQPGGEYDVDVVDNGELEEIAQDLDAWSVADARDWAKFERSTAPRVPTTPRSPGPTIRTAGSTS